MAENANHIHLLRRDNKERGLAGDKGPPDSPCKANLVAWGPPQHKSLWFLFAELGQSGHQGFSRCWLENNREKGINQLIADPLTANTSPPPIKPVSTAQADLG